jgi:hypothetical protein
VEDRITSHLYLEMTNLQPAEFAERRVDDVVATAGVERATWWENCVPNRPDLPRTLDEFSTLGVFECDATFVPPERPPGIDGYHFRHYPRPGQGTISSKPTLGLELVLISPRTGREAQELRDWGDFVHIHDIAAAQPPHFTMITPYENVTGGSPRYMHFYELDTDDPEPAFRAMTAYTRARASGDGAWNTHSFTEWMHHQALVINYVNTFRRLGVRTP